MGEFRSRQSLDFMTLNVASMAYHPRSCWIGLVLAMVRERKLPLTWQSEVHRETRKGLSTVHTAIPKDPRGRKFRKAPLESSFHAWLTRRYWP